MSGSSQRSRARAEVAAQATPATVGLVVPDLGRPSGGSVYNAEIARARRELGGDAPALDVIAVPIEGPSSVRTGTVDAHADDVATALAAALGRHTIAIVDGLLASEHPAAIEAATGRGTRVALLMHMARPDEPGLAPAERERLTRLEARAMRAASAVIVPSRHAARDLAARYGRDDIAVAHPGVRPAPLASPHEPPGILQLGAIGPLKNQALLLEAATRVRDLPFRMRMVGPTVDVAYATRLRERAGAELPAHTAGPEAALQGDALEAAFAGSDLLVSVSTREAYGLVVTEALARGIPAVVGRDTGAEEALAAGGEGHAGPAEAAGNELPGTTVSTRDPAELAAVLRRWLTDPVLRADWRRRAAAARDRLPGWDATASAVLEVVRRLDGADTPADPSTGR